MKGFKKCVQLSCPSSTLHLARGPLPSGMRSARLVAGCRIAAIAALAACLAHAAQGLPVCDDDRLELHSPASSCELPPGLFPHHANVSGGALISVGGNTTFTGLIQVGSGGAIIGNDSAPVRDLAECQAELDACTVVVPDEVPAGTILPPGSYQESVCVQLDFDNSTQVAAVFSHDFNVTREIMQQEAANGGNALSEYVFDVPEDL